MSHLRVPGKKAIPSEPVDAIIRNQRAAIQSGTHRYVYYSQDLFTIRYTARATIFLSSVISIWSDKGIATGINPCVLEQQTTSTFPVDWEDIPMMCHMQGFSVCCNLAIKRLYMIKYVTAAFFTVAVIGMGLIFSEARAQEHRHHEAHEHGGASLNVAVEGSNIYIEFSSPAANIVGFEHHPRTNDQKDAVKSAVNKLQQGDALFILSAGSESRLVKASVDTDIDEDADHHSESAHAHGEEEHHDKEHSEADEQGRHSDFKAEYHFVSKNPDKLSQIDVKLFGVFPGIEHIEVQLITEKMQTAVELKAKKNRLSL